MAQRNCSQDIHWIFLGRILLLIFSVLQIFRWRITPQFLDIYYHLLTAWGFNQAGGYTGWDFWQYAPFGRMHIYPPFFHILLGAFMKIGFDKLLLIRICETASPILALFTVHYFVKKHYSPRLAFFALLVAVSSFSFYMNLMNRIPSALAIIIGLLAYDQLLEGKILRTVLLLSLSFYTHIGVSWFFSLGLLFYGFFNKERMKFCLSIACLTLIISCPVIVKQILTVNAVERTGFQLTKTLRSQYKIFEYLLVFPGLFFSFKGPKKYRLSAALFFASLIFVIYPYRFFSGEGFLPVVFLAAIGLDGLYKNFFEKKNFFIRSSAVAFISVYFFFISPTILNKNPLIRARSDVQFRLFFSHTAFMGMAFPEDISRGFYDFIFFCYDAPVFIETANLIKEYTHKEDIIFSNVNLLGVIVASLSGRPTSNALFPEIGPSQGFDPISSSNVILFTKDEDLTWTESVIEKYGLVKFSENKIFNFYNHPEAREKARFGRASIPFWAIGLIALLFIFLYSTDNKSIVRNFLKVHS
ncbi:MAG: hypothetical protein ABIA17_03315 [Elusimicrobiota bacterium]